MSKFEYMQVVNLLKNYWGLSNIRKGLYIIRGRLNQAINKK